MSILGTGRIIKVGKRIALIFFAYPLNQLTRTRIGTECIQKIFKQLITFVFPFRFAIQLVRVNPIELLFLVLF